MKVDKVLYTLLSIGIFLFSCGKDDKDGYRRVEWTSIKTINIDNSNEGVVLLDSGDSVFAKAYGIAVDFEDSVNNFSHGGSIENAESYENANHIRSISIYCLQSFNETHPAGTSLNNYFKLRAGSRKFATPQLSNAEPLEIYNLGSVNDVLLYEMPFRASIYQFVVKVEFANSKVLADTTTPVYLIP